MKAEETCLSSQSNLSLVVMAAGMGSRFGGIKQLAAFGPNGETLLEYSVYDALRAGFSKIIFVIRKEIEDAFSEMVLSRFPKHLNIEIVYQELGYLPEGYVVPIGRKKPWGTGHAVLMAMPEINGPFAVINADDFYGASAFATLAQSLQEESSSERTQSCYVMVGYALQNTLSEHGSVSRGVCKVDADGRLLDLTEHTRIFSKDGKIRSDLPDGTSVEFSGQERVSLNLWGFPKEFLASLKKQFNVFLETHVNEVGSEFYLPSAVNHDIDSQEAMVKVLPTEEHWFGVTYQNDLPRVQKAIAAKVEAGEYPQTLW